MTLSLLLVTQEQWDSCLLDRSSLLFLEAGIKPTWWKTGIATWLNQQLYFSALVPVVSLFQFASFPECFWWRRGGNKRMSSGSFLLLPSKEIISACEMTSRKTAWNCLFSLHISLQPWAWDCFQWDKMASDILPHTEQTMEQSSFKPVPPSHCNHLDGLIAC